MDSPENQLRGFIAKFDPSLQRLIRAVRKSMRARMPAANELVYDNYNFFVIGYSPTERPSDTILSIAAAANGVVLSFYRGTSVPDPEKVLLGAGSQNRFVRIAGAGDLERPEVKRVISAAIALANPPLPGSGKSKLIIRSISAKQRPRRKPATSRD